jgi:energy-coupling factor transporter transmembrane protein EcfT
MTYPEPGAGSQVPPAYADPQHQQIKSGGEKPQRNVIALIALIVAILGFIFACIPGALIVGWVLLPIAFVLSIVSLFLKGKGKGLGIAGLIVSIVGTIVAIVVFFAVVATSIDEAFNDESVVVEASEAPADQATGDAPANESTEVGTRDNPSTIGSTISSETWSVVINSFNPDAGVAVAEANSFNEAAPAGSHYGIVNYTVTYTGEDSAYAAEVGVDLVTASGNVVNSYETMVLLNDSMGLDELFTGASATGSAAFVIPDGEDVLIRVRPGMLADEMFITP